MPSMALSAMRTSIHRGISAKGQRAGAFSAMKTPRAIETIPAVRAILQESRRCRSAGFLCRQFVDRGAYRAIEERHGLDDQSRGAFAQLPRELFRRDGDRLAT